MLVCLACGFLVFGLILFGAIGFALATAAAAGAHSAGARRSSVAASSATLSETRDGGNQRDAANYQVKRLLERQSITTREPPRRSPSAWMAGPV